MNWAVVMAGGPGTRFWPESRRDHPKPFLKLVGGRTLLETAVNRLAPLFPPERILIVLQKKLLAKARRLLPKIPKKNFLGEPVSRNTAPCAIWAAFEIAKRDPAARFVFLPADQHIKPEVLFRKTLQVALEIADENPVLIGFRPTSPSPAYGYVEVSRPKKLKKGIQHFNVKRFCEKPSPAQARQFLKKGNFLWNGGVFAWQLESFREAAKIHLPRIYQAFEKLQGRKVERIYPALSSVSLDYGIMEKLKQAHCLVAPIRWSDLGSWSGFAEFWKEDARGNRIAGTGRKPAPAILIDSKQNLVKSNRRAVALIGVNDFLVVDTEDALLICDRNQTERIREVVQALEKRKADEYL